MLNELTEYKRLGYYSVGDKILINKADALIEATSSKNNVHWNFNDEIFSFIDWTIPIDVSLNELYRQRAQQLRDKYDYLSLYYSGGVDSTNVLHAFIDNNILLDEIVMYRPKLLDTFTNRIDRSNNNVFSEIEFAAIPHLKKYIKDPRTNIRIINIDTSLDNFLKDDNLVSEFQTINLFMPTGAGRLSRWSCSSA